MGGGHSFSITCSISVIEAFFSTSVLTPFAASLHAAHSSAELLVVLQSERPSQIWRPSWGERLRFRG